MIIPSIDLMNGVVVQLIGGREKALEAGDAGSLAETFRLAGEIAVVDLDAALGRGDNTAVMRDLLRVAPCRVGGGIRSVEAARRWLDDGATKVVLGTAAQPDVLRQLPRERVIAALDADHDEVVVEGWQKGTGRGIIERMREIRDLVGGFLVTFVEREGRMGGVDLQRVEQLLAECGGARLTVAGGVTTAEEIAALDRLGVDAQVGMAIYTGRLGLAEAIAAPLTSDRPDGLWPTVVVDQSGVALGLAYSDLDSLREAVRTRRGVYHSRSRGLWIKGESSGDTQDLLRVDLDCDRDTLRFTVRQHGAGFCHLSARTCWGPDHGVGELARRLQQLAENAPAESYTRRLLADADLLRAKLTEESNELAQAQAHDEVVGEAADLLYFTLVAMARGKVTLPEVEAELKRRARRVTRRPGDAKPERENK